MYILITYPHFKATLESGLPAAGYKVWVYDAGDSSPTDSYVDHLLVTKNTNPIVLGEDGEAIIYVDRAVKLVYTAPTGTPASPIWTMDYLGEQQEDIIQIASAIPVTTYNNYRANTVPPYTSLPQDGFTLILIPDVDNLGTTPTTVFIGTGKNDCFIYGPYTGTTSGSIFTVTIDDATSTPNTFKWQKDGGAFTTGVAITTSLQTLIEGMTLQFAEATGHTLNDTWSVQVVTPARLNFCSLGNLIIYKNQGGSLVALSSGDMKAGIPASLALGDSGSLWILNNPSSEVAPTTTGRRARKEETTDYNLLTTDAGDLIAFINPAPAALNLGAAVTYKDMFFYVRAGGAAIVTITANGSEKIYGKHAPAGATTYTLYPGYGETVQIQCNGVSWEVMTETDGPLSVTQYLTAGTYTYARPLDVIALIIEVYGGGAGGGALDKSPKVYPGGGGGYARLYIDDASAITTVQVTVGAGGSNYWFFSATEYQTAGETSSFGALVSATGGLIQPDGDGNLCGVGVGGDINLLGHTIYLNDSITVLATRAAGPLGGGTPAPAASSGKAGLAIGGGGGTAANGPNSNPNTKGADGAVIITEIR